MKFDIPPPEVYRAKPPSVHAWMRRYYCPVLESALSPSFLEPMLDWYRDIVVERAYLSYESHSAMRHICIELNMCIKGKRPLPSPITVSGDRLANDQVGVSVDFYFRAEGDILEQYTVLGGHLLTFPLGGGLYLLPYMFRTVPVSGVRDGTLIVDVPEHWIKLERLGLIPKDLKETIKMG